MATTSKLEIKTAFLKENAEKKTEFSVQILGESSQNVFVIADKTADCKLVLDNPKQNVKKYIKDKAFVRILNPKLNLQEKSLVVHAKTSVFPAKTFDGVFTPKHANYLQPSTSSSLNDSPKRFPKAMGNVLAGSKPLSDFFESPSGKVIFSLVSIDFKLIKCVVLMLIHGKILKWTVKENEIIGKIVKIFK